MSGKQKQAPDREITDPEDRKTQEKIEKSQKTAPKPEHPCPYCGNELPPDFVKDPKGDISLNLTDANTYGDLKAEEDYQMNHLEIDREDMNEFLQDLAAEKYGYYNNNPGIDWDKGVLTGVDANNETIFTEHEVTKEEIKKSQKLFHKLQKRASKTRRASAKRKLKLNEYARKYKWNSFPCDIRNNKFVDITTEMLKQQDVRLQQIEQQLRTPRIKDEEK